VKRTAIIAVWLASLAAAYLAGLAGAGSSDSGQGEASPRSVGTAARKTHEAQIGIGSDVPERRGTADPLTRAEALVSEGRPYEALDVLDEFFQLTHPEATERYSRALFLLSDLRQMTGEVEGALAPLFDILRYPATPAIAERARRRLNLLINAREQQLINAGDLVGLIAYFEFLVREEPAYDGHRLKLARWLLRSGDVSGAERLVREIGLVGVTQAEIEALESEIRLAATALPVERQGGAMYTAAVAAGQKRQSEVRFLIDTGATMSGLAESRLKTLGAVLIDEGIRVQTANGVVELPVYRLRELRIGALVLEDLVVLGFADLPRRADGLLGMDVLGQLSGSMPDAVGRP